MKRECLECKTSIWGRLDKKFCSDQCRSTYYNRRNGQTLNFMRRVNRILRQNHRILADLNPGGRTRLHREQLLAAGFRFAYFTNEYVTRSGKVYRFCYDQGYLELEDGYVALVEREEYVE